MDYRVGWADENTLNADLVNHSLSTYIKENHGLLYSYFVPVESISFDKQQDMCAEMK